MSVVCILVPAVVAGWPAVSSAAAGAAALLGLNLVSEARELMRLEEEIEQEQTVEIEVENAEVLEEQVSQQERMILTKGDVKVRIYRTERGELKVCVSGKNMSRHEMQELGEELVQKITQVYVYNKVMSELRQRGFDVTREEVTEDQSVHLHVRNDGN